MSDGGEQGKLLFLALHVMFGEPVLHQSLKLRLSHKYIFQVALRYSEQIKIEATADFGFLAIALNSFLIREMFRAIVFHREQALESIALDYDKIQMGSQAI